MKMKWILVTAILVLLAVFALQNYQAVQIKFLVWSFDSSSAIIIFVSLALGVLIGLLMSIRKKLPNNN